jgi:hypothetical protein
MDMLEKYVSKRVYDKYYNNILIEFIQKKEHTKMQDYILESNL